MKNTHLAKILGTAFLATAVCTFIPKKPIEDNHKNIIVYEIAKKYPDKTVSMLAKNHENGKINIDKISRKIKKYESYIIEKSRKYGVPAEIAFGKFMKESSGNPKAERNGYVGLGGLGIIEAEECGIAKTVDGKIIYDCRENPKKNIECSLYHLSKNYKEFMDWNISLAAYNTGKTKIRKIVNEYKEKNELKICSWSDIKNSKKISHITKDYVPKVSALGKMYFNQKLYSN